ncbi:hypothetical protein PGB90_001871 [Kerria lacca]
MKKKEKKIDKYLSNPQADTYGTKEINVEEFKQKYLGVILPFKYDKNKEMVKELSQKEYGGDFNSDEGCLPYQIRPCGPFMDSHKMPCAYYTANTPKYTKWCSINGNISYTTEYLMRKEIYKNGPITAAFLM